MKILLYWVYALDTTLRVTLLLPSGVSLFIERPRTPFPYSIQEILLLQKSTISPIGGKFILHRSTR